MKRWLALSIAVVFAAGVALGWVASRSSHPTTQGRGPGFTGPFDPVTSVFSRPEMYKELDLSEQQQSAINQLLASQEKRFGELRDSMSAISGEVRNGIYDVLTPEQEKRFDDLQEERARKEIEFRVGQEVIALKKDLSLSGPEESQIHSILIGYSLDKRKIFERSRKEPCDIRAESEALRTKRDAQIKEILPAEKFATYQERKSRERRFPGGGQPWHSENGAKPDGKGPPRELMGPKPAPTP